MNYRQCLLQKGTKGKITWIPEKFAKKGKVIKLKDENGWIVKEVWGRDTEENVKARERVHLRWAEGRGLKK